MLIDTHCHIHESDYPLDAEETLIKANKNGVKQIICVGTDPKSSKEAINFANNHQGVFASVGIHPYYAKEGIKNLEKLIDKNNKKIVAIGETGLDYSSTRSSKTDQIKLLKAQIELALKYDLPIIFHVRDAFKDFWPVFDAYKGIRGVLHCYSDTLDNAKEGIKRGLYIGINGISTFTKDENQKKMFESIPIEKILLETDAPYLTPVPFRGTINEPAYVREVAVFSGKTRNISETEVARATTANAKALFSL